MPRPLLHGPPREKSAALRCTDGAKRKGVKAEEGERRRGERVSGIKGESGSIGRAAKRERGCKRRTRERVIKRGGKKEEGVIARRAAMLYGCEMKICTV